VSGQVLIQSKNQNARSRTFGGIDRNTFVFCSSVKPVLLRIVTVLASVALALCAAAYASAGFNFEISPGFHEGTPITAIVFMSVFIPLFVFLVATGAWLINRKYKNPLDSN